MIRGIDVSNNNGSIDWPAVSKAGYSFAFCKATEGLTYRDPTFAQNAHGAALAGLITGAYHYAHPGDGDPVAEADALCDAAQSIGVDLPPVLDLEVAEGLNGAQLTDY